MKNYVVRLGTAGLLHVLARVKVIIDTTINGKIKATESFNRW